MKWLKFIIFSFLYVHFYLLLAMIVSITLKLPFYLIDPLVKLSGSPLLETGYSIVTLVIFVPVTVILLAMVLWFTPQSAWNSAMLGMDLNASIRKAFRDFSVLAGKFPIVGRFFQLRLEAYRQDDQA